MAKHTKRKLRNTVEMPLNMQRDIILEADSTYLANLRAWKDRMWVGPVEQRTTQREFESMRQWLQMAALRRAGKSLKESRILLAAS